MADPLAVGALAFAAVIAVGTVLVAVNDILETRREELLARGRRGLARVRSGGASLVRASRAGRAGARKMAGLVAKRGFDRRRVVSDWY
jgi:hypothetical protein